MSLKRLSGLALAGALFLCGCTGENVTEVTIVPTGESLSERVGPVSQYGQLMAGAVDGKGAIYGSCKGIAAGEEVQVRGMSLYWSLLPQATMYYSDAGISAMVRDMKVELVRAAIGTMENWGGTLGFIDDPDAQRELIDATVMAAVKNDIYVIIDWHSHTATNQQEEAVAFFTEMAQKYGQFNNVIFEVFNEPTNQPWTEIKAYAETVIAAIRLYSDNLVLVGNPTWDQSPNKAIGNEVEDPAHNVAYTFHYYANSHTIAGQGRNAERAINAGLSVFVSEWGAGKADGKGKPIIKYNDDWQDWMDKYKLSSANWSASQINEGTAAFTGESTDSTLVFSESGALVKSYLDKNPDKYTKCSAK